MVLPLDERKRATIVRKGKPATLKFERIKDLAAKWAKPVVTPNERRARSPTN
jgi:hypothetical protein